MKKTSMMTFILLATLTGKAFAQKNSSLPDIPAPRELTEVGSEFAEGTITRLSDGEASVFVPWAQNAQSVLTKALRDIQTMTVQQQVRHLTAIMKSVVTNSGSKNYQMFMRFVLNRTLLLVQETVNQSDWNVPGTAESVLDLQVTGINLALKFYESDLSYQSRANRGNDSVNQSYAVFGATFGKEMIRSIQNITDASAQYRVLYKTLEMINWDFSRDAIAIEFSDAIVEIYNTLNTLNEQPTNNDSESVLAIRRLNVLVNSVVAVERTILLSNESTRRTLEERERLERLQAEQRQMEINVARGISVLSNDKFYVVLGNNELERHRDCLSKQTAQTDSILVMQGNRTPQKYYNGSSYWSADTACRMIINGNTQMELSKSFNFYGEIEKKGYSFQAPTVSSLMYQCHTFLQVNRINQTDIFTIGQNNSVPRIYTNSSSYWRGSSSICSAILDKVL